MKIINKSVSVFLAVVLLVGVLPISGLDSLELFAPKAEAYSVGDTIQFGTYPQSRVTDETTLALLNATGTEWHSYGYYSGTGSWSDGQMTSSNYMQYRDAAVGGVKYRAVKFTKYRPYYTGYTSSASHSYQDDNGYYIDTVYWFRFDPIVWKILDPSDGLAVCESIIDSQPYSNYIKYENSYYRNDKGTYANNYEDSSIRAWLIDDFYNTAFTDGQKDNIKDTTLDNSAYNTSYSIYDSPSTTDKVFLLSWNDALNVSYGFTNSLSSTATRQASGSDYAKCQGLYVYSGNGFSYVVVALCRQLQL